MASDSLPQDLYPPDVEDPTATALEQRKRVVVGTALVVWGTSLLVQRALGVDLDTFALGLGLAALAGWLQVPRYPWFVAGAILTGSGVGELLSAPFDDGFGAAVSCLSIAVGFAAVYVRYPRRSSWALPAAAIFGLIAVGALGIGLIGLVPAVLGRFLLPLLLIGGGGLLLARHSLPPRTVRIGLAGLAVAFVLVGATSVPEIDHAPPPVGLERFGSGSSSQPLPLSAGDTLRMVSGGSGDIVLRTGDRATIEVRDGERRGLRGGIEISRADEVLSVGADGFAGGDDHADYVVTLPPGIVVDLERGAGSITGMLAGARGTIRTKDGNIDLELEDGGDEGFTDEGPLDVETVDGSVRIESELLLDLDLGGEGDVIVNRENRNGRFRSPPGTLGVELEVDARGGDIVIDMPDPPDPPEEPAPPQAPNVPAS